MVLFDYLINFLFKTLSQINYEPLVFNFGGLIGSFYELELAFGLVKTVGCTL